jgi:hypothetical protein
MLTAGDLHRPFRTLEPENDISPGVPLRCTPGCEYSAAPRLNSRGYSYAKQRPGGRRLWGHAHTNKELAGAARKEIKKLKSAH